jgi:hypothetical protein
MAALMPKQIIDLPTPEESILPPRQSTSIVHKGHFSAEASAAMANCRNTPNKAGRNTHTRALFAAKPGCRVLVPGIVSLVRCNAAERD